MLLYLTSNKFAKDGGTNLIQQKLLYKRLWQKPLFYKTNDKLLKP